jgi:hypothetical protein
MLSRDENDGSSPGEAEKASEKCVIFMCVRRFLADQADHEYAAPALGCHRFFAGWTKARNASKEVPRQI